VRLLPPLIITKSDVDEALTKLHNACAHLAVKV
jgi:acetylornithine/succinyldiaminopimelate/putrescine aminotransferase